MHVCCLCACEGRTERLKYASTTKEAIKQQPAVKRATAGVSLPPPLHRSLFLVLAMGTLCPGQDVTRTRFDPNNFATPGLSCRGNTGGVTGVLKKGYFRGRISFDFS